MQKEQEQEEFIKNYAKQLEKSQGQFREFYNKKYKENKIIKNLYDNSLLDENQEKDW